MSKLLDALEISIPVTSSQDKQNEDKLVSTKETGNNDIPVMDEGACADHGSLFCTLPECPEIKAKGTEEITGQPIFCGKYEELRTYRRLSV
jgi:hypothetical protein